MGARTRCAAAGIDRARPRARARVRVRVRVRASSADVKDTSPALVHGVG